MIKSVAKRRKRYQAWLLAGLLVLIAQTVSAVHELDPESQTPDHVCEVCVAAASADGANVGQPSVFAATPQVADSSVDVAATITVAPTFLPPARGPPATS